MSHLQSLGGAQPQNPFARSLAYVIEVGETQAGLVSRGPDERFFTFISALSAYDGLDGQRFATPAAAEIAVRQIGAPRRRMS